MKKATRSDADVLSHYVELSELILKNYGKIDIIKKALGNAKNERGRIEAGLFSPNNGHSLEICDEKISAWEAECRGLQLELKKYESELTQIDEKYYKQRGPKYVSSYN